MSQPVTKIETRSSSKTDISPRNLAGMIIQNGTNAFTGSDLGMVGTKIKENQMQFCSLPFSQ